MMERDELRAQLMRLATTYVDDLEARRAILDLIGADPTARVRQILHKIDKYGRQLPASEEQLLHDIAYYYM
jgi:hypothetical protein